MRCSNCGRENSDASKFCTGCGTKMDAPVMQATASPAQTEQPLSACPKCKKPVKAGAKFCTSCGSKIDAPAINESPPAAYAPPVFAAPASHAPLKKKRTGIIVTACALLLTVVGGITVWQLQKRNYPTVPAASAASAISEASSTQGASVPEPAQSPGQPATPAEAPMVAQLAIEPQYDALNGGFDDYGRARVKTGDEWHLIDRSGNILTNYSYDSINFFYENLAVVVRNGKFGYIDTDGNEVISAQFDNAFSFSEDGLARVVIDGKHGYIDSNGDVVIDPILDDAKGFSDGYASVYYEAGRFYIDIYNYRVSEFYQDALSFSEGLAAVKLYDRWGYVDTDFNIVISPQFDAANSFVEGLAIVELNGKQFFIDAFGNRFSVESTRLWNFSDGYATALLGDKYGFVSRETGEFAIVPEYTDVWAFTGGLAPVTDDGVRWFYVNAQNEPQFDGKNWQEAHKFNGELAKIRESGRWGFIDAEGNEIVPAEWDDAHLYTGGMIGVCRDGKWGFLEVISR